MEEECYDYATLSVITSQTTVFSTSYTVTDQLPLTYCCINVTSNSNCDGSNLTSSRMLACGQSKNAAPGGVENLAISSPNANSLLVRWDAPEDYRSLGLTYTLSYGDVTLDTGNNFYYITNLTQNTQYTVSVMAEGSSVAQQANETTLPDTPPAPIDVTLSSSGSLSVVIIVAWNDPNAIEYNVTSYRVLMRCNEMNFNKTVTVRQATFNLDTNGSFFWCAAQVQGINTVGGGQLSAVGQLALPNIPPNTPSCFMAEDMNSRLLFSFTITDAISLSNLVINYAIRNQSDGDVLNQTINLRNYQQNGINISIGLLNRRTRYTFALRLCNAQGCGGECQKTFNISSVSVLLCVCVCYRGNS